MCLVTSYGFCGVDMLGMAVSPNHSMSVIHYPLVHQKLLVAFDERVSKPTKHEGHGSSTWNLSYRVHGYVTSQPQFFAATRCCMKATEWHCCGL